jgi:hypothetical protein
MLSAKERDKSKLTISDLKEKQKKRKTDKY